MRAPLRYLFFIEDVQHAPLHPLSATRDPLENVIAPSTGDTSMTLSVGAVKRTLLSKVRPAAIYRESLPFSLSPREESIRA